MPLIIFDCDGVLVDSEALENEIMAQCLSEVGWPMSGVEARERFIGLAMPSVIEQAQTHLGRALPQNWLADFHAISHARLAREIEAIDGVINLSTRSRLWVGPPLLPRRVSIQR